ncbi:hypothetical protein CYK05_07535 [Rothia mucilaginosa]|nr:hypothetical protein HMPREF2879_09115 [Rothia sp. HMSC069C04]PLA61782.1 hypothetical protein CYK05_07535 [Rothia mucilaginosa]
MYVLAGFFTPGNAGSSYAISPVCGLEWVRGGAGGAGGSYLAPSVRNGAIVGTKEAPAGPNVRVNGMAEDRFK